MSMSVEEFKEYIKELIKKELEEVSVTGALDGGGPAALLCRPADGGHDW